MLAIQDALERGSLHGPCANLLARAWRSTAGRTVHRTLSFPRGVRVIAVGGATLGGSGKTPVAIACAVELAAAGARVALVGHAYRAKPGAARIVSTADPVEQVGDEALVAAGTLEGLGARVVVGPTRASAVALAAREADVLVLDGVSQAAPIRATLALLSLDAATPWGRAQALPPCGDLRAPPATLLEACDAIVAIVDGPSFSELRFEPMAPGRLLWPARAICRGAWTPDGSLLTWDALRSVRIGLLTALGRPERLLLALARRGVKPHVVIRGRDHGPVRAEGADERAAQEKIDLWLATPKCALHVRKASLGAPLATLDHSVVLHPRLCEHLRAIALP